MRHPGPARALLGASSAPLSVARLVRCSSFALRSRFSPPRSPDRRQPATGKGGPPSFVPGPPARAPPSPGVGFGGVSGWGAASGVSRGGILRGAAPRGASGARLVRCVPFCVPCGLAPPRSPGSRGPFARGCSRGLLSPGPLRGCVSGSGRPRVCLALGLVSGVSRFGTPRGAALPGSSRVRLVRCAPFALRRALPRGAAPPSRARLARLRLAALLSPGVRLGGRLVPGPFVSPRDSSLGCLASGFCAGPLVPVRLARVSRGLFRLRSVGPCSGVRLPPRGAFCRAAVLAGFCPRASGRRSSRARGCPRPRLWPSRVGIVGGASSRGFSRARLVRCVPFAFRRARARGASLPSRGPFARRCSRGLLPPGLLRGGVSGRGPPLLLVLGVSPFGILRGGPRAGASRARLARWPPFALRRALLRGASPPSRGRLGPGCSRGLLSPGLRFPFVSGRGPPPRARLGRVSSRDWARGVVSPLVSGASRPLCVVCAPSGFRSGAVSPFPRGFGPRLFSRPFVPGVVPRLRFVLGASSRGVSLWGVSRRGPFGAGLARGASGARLVGSLPFVLRWRLAAPRCCAPGAGGRLCPRASSGPSCVCVPGAEPREQTGRSPTDGDQSETRERRGTGRDDPRGKATGQTGTGTGRTQNGGRRTTRTRGRTAAERKRKTTDQTHRRTNGRRHQNRNPRRDTAAGGVSKREGFAPPPPNKDPLSPRFLLRPFAFFRGWVL